MTTAPSLKFGVGNSKLGSHIAIFDLPAGYTCPGAKDCLAFSNRENGKITDGKNAQFRCYSASVEVLYSKTRNARWHNYELLRGKTSKQMAEIISAFLPKHGVIRIHSSGDFFNKSYFLAWLTIARNNPNQIFYAYTKMVNYWIKYKDSIPPNFKLNASLGGKFDKLAVENGLKTVRVVYSPEEAEKLGLKIDIDDTLAYSQENSFSLLIHGVQKKGTEAAKASRKYRNYKKTLNEKV